MQGDVQSAQYHDAQCFVCTMTALGHITLITRRGQNLDERHSGCHDSSSMSGVP